MEFLYFGSKGWGDELFFATLMTVAVSIAAMAIGIAGATNAGLMAASILAIQDETVRATLKLWRSELTSSVPDEPKDF